MKTCGLYIHIPFCQSKCLYCDFPSYCHLEGLVSPYVAALKKEIELVGLRYSKTKVKSIFIGGGTPTYIHSKFIGEILKTVKDTFEVEKDAEVSMEANPGTFDLQQLLVYKEAGINRLSMGLQAWQNHLLKKLGRIHNQQEFVQAFKDARTAGFQNINVDLMFGLPDQSLENWKETLERVCALQPTHLSCYSLKIEEGTPFDVLQKKGKLLIDEDIEREMYYYTKKYLKSCGFNHYEISNFALPGFECKHNLIYWEVEPYIGVGAAAHSYMNRSRFSNTESVSEYIEAINNEQLPIVDQYQVTQEQIMQEYIFLGLRKIEGISQTDFFKIFGQSLEDVYGTILKDLQQKGLIKKEEKIFLTSKGLDYANYVFQAFL